MQNCEIDESNIYNPIQPEKKSYIDMLKEAFLNIPEKIEEELKRSEKNNNNWLSCFGDQVCKIVNILYFVSKESEPDKQILIREKIQGLFIDCAN